MKKLYIESKIKFYDIVWFRSIRIYIEILRLLQVAKRNCTKQENYAKTRYFVFFCHKYALQLNQQRLFALISLNIDILCFDHASQFCVEFCS